MSNSSQSINEVVSDLVHDVDIRQHLVQRQHLPTECSTCTVPLLTLPALQLYTADCRGTPTGYAEAREAAGGGRQQGHEPLQLGMREQCPKLLVHVHFLISNLRKTVCGKVSIHQSWQPRNTLNSFSTGAPPGPRRGFTVDWDETALSHPNSRCLWHLFLGAFHTLSLKFVPTS